MAKRIYVGGLAYATSDQELENLFAKSGTVTSASVVTDKYTGQSKGFGFVDMENDNEAENAIRTLNQSTLAGRTLTVNEAKPREDRPRSSFGGGGGGYGGGGGNRGDRGGNRGGRW
jgi:RNA recognition motif-containing protein